MYWILFSLLAPLFWATSNLLDKYLLDKRVRSMVDYVFFSSIGSLLVIIVLLIKGYGSASPELIIWSMLAGLLGNIAYILYYHALGEDDTSSVVPLFQLIPIFVFIIGWIFFDEILTKTHIVAFIIMFIGGVILSTDFSEKIKVRKSFWLMLGSSLLLGIDISFADQAAEIGSVASVILYSSIGFALVIPLMFIYKPWRIEIKDALKESRAKKYLFFFTNDIVDLSGGIFSVIALSLAPAAALVTVVEAVQPFYVLILIFISSQFFPKFVKENFEKKVILQKIIGILIISIGIIYLSI